MATTWYTGFDSLSKGSVTNTSASHVLYPHSQHGVFEASTAQPDDEDRLYQKLLSIRFTMASDAPEDSSRPAAPSSHEPRTETEHEVTRLSRRIMELLNARAYDDPFFPTQVSPSVYISLNGRIGNGIDDLINFHRSDADLNPQHHCSDETITVTANEAQGTATTITNQVARHLGGDHLRGQRRSGTILWSWRRVEGTWMLQSCSLMAPPTASNAPQDSSPVTTLPPQSPTNTDVEIIRLTRRIIDLQNARSFDDPFSWDHVSPSVFVDYNGERISSGLEDFLGYYKSEASVNPSFFCDVQTITAMANDQRGTATAISTHISKAFADEQLQTKRKAATILWSWKKVEETWWLQSCTSMVGTCEYLV